MHGIKKALDKGVGKVNSGIGKLGIVDKLPTSQKDGYNRYLEEAKEHGYLSHAALTQIRGATKVQKEPEDPFPKDLVNLKEETVTKRWYEWEKKAWETKTINVKIADEHFAEGGMRVAHFMLLCGEDGAPDERLVAKRQKEDANRVELYDTDVMMQAACQAIANAFNQRKPFKKVDFVDCYVIQRKDGTWWGVEPYLTGKYIKYNNNYGYVDKDSRNTPQAFTHFSHEYTEGKMMIVDIQGVGDHYTDPQIHTADGEGFGMGNIGQRGIDRFFKTHWCNPICVHLGLKFCTPKTLGIKRHSKPKEKGTVVGGRNNHDGSAESTSSGPPESFHISDYVGDFKPQKGGASSDDLALLGINEKQFVAIAQVFNSLDTNHDGCLSKEELFPIMDKVAAQEHASLSDLMRRIQGKVDKDGNISFRDFLLCWTASD